MVGMHLLQWIHNPLVDALGLEFVDQLWVPEERTRHGDEFESFIQCVLDGVDAVDAAEQDQWHPQRLSELTGEGQEEALLERVRRKEFGTVELQPVPDEFGLGGDKLSQWDLAAEEVHSVEK